MAVSINKNKNVQAQEKSDMANMAVNPNPRANENITDSEKQETKATQNTDQVGNEITDGEDG